MSNSFASLVILSYNRPQFVVDAIRSARDTAEYPLEIIVHDDGSDNRTQDILHGMLQASEFSKLILNPPGENQGVGESVRVGFAAASGDYLIKADQDLLFQPGWLRWAVGLLDRETAVGMAGLFHYNHAPAPSRQMLLAQHDGWQEHKDFISSAFAIRAADWERWSKVWETHSDAFAEDVALKLHMQDVDVLKLALPDSDLAVNRGFGVGPSTVALGIGPGQVQSIQHEPVMFHRPLPPPVMVEHVEKNDGTPPAPLVTYDTKHYPERVGKEDDFTVGVVIPTTAGRTPNLRLVLSSLDAQTERPLAVVIVWDGCAHEEIGVHPYPIRHVAIPKHHPGMEQPRNTGVRHLQQICPQANYVWFLDSDVVVEPTALAEYHAAHVACGYEPHIIVGPYEFLPPLLAGIHPEVRTDYRWISFREYGVEHVLRRELGSGLACFGGNLLWPIARFTEVGGFHPDLHHGRCEDGELGLRAASLGIGISFAAKARGYHQHHSVDQVSAMQKNQRDVPLLNSFHPWVEGQGLIVTHEDGARFDFKCPLCETQVNSLLYWEHYGSHGGSVHSG